MKKTILIFSLFFLLRAASLETLSYNAQFKNIGAGTAILRTKLLDNEKEIYFSFKTKKFVDLFYKIRENILMIVNSDNYSLKFLTTDSQNGKRFKKHEAHFSYSDNKVYFNNDSLIINQFVYNPISIISFLRNQKLSIGNKYNFDIYNRGKIKSIGMEVINEETVKIKKKSYDCFVLVPFYLSSADENNKKGDIKLWIAKDSSLPIIIEQNANFGEISLKLSDVNYEH